VLGYDLLMGVTSNGQATSHESVRAVVDRLRARREEIARAIHDCIHEAVPSSLGARDPAYQAGVLAAVHAVLSYSLDATEHEHEQERQPTRHSPEQRRLDLLQRLLDGESVSPAELAELSYRFDDAWHIGMIAVGPKGRAALEALKADRQLLAVSSSEETVLAWLGGRRRPTHEDLERIRLDGEHVGVSLALGEPAKGLQGCRDTHEQAQQALQVALFAGQQRVRFADIAALTPWVRHPDRARTFVRLYLAPLECHKDHGAVSLQTLLAYFGAGWNASSAARELGIDRRTLTYRIGAIEESLGYKLDTRKAELEIAMRLHALLKRHEMHNMGKNPSLGFPTLS
jgi:DNA-binding PucR family transcriptional regulator